MLCQLELYFDHNQVPLTIILSFCLLRCHFIIAHGRNPLWRISPTLLPWDTATLSLARFLRPVHPPVPSVHSTVAVAGRCRPALKRRRSKENRRAKKRLEWRRLQKQGLKGTGGQESGGPAEQGTGRPGLAVSAPSRPAAAPPLRHMAGPGVSPTPWRNWRRCAPRSGRRPGW